MTGDSILKFSDKFWWKEFRHLDGGVDVGESDDITYGFRSLGFIILNFKD